MMRAFRVFRLFKRVESLRKIMQSLSRAVPGVANAFFIQVLVMSIYAILGVEFFMTYGENGSYTNEFGEVVELTTARDLKFGYEYFGNFGKALFTMFQVLTGESWSEVVTRPLLHTTDPTQAIGVSFFFVSFNLVNGIVLINVAIAVLLEKMVDDEDKSGQKEPPSEGTTVDFDAVEAFQPEVEPGGDDFDKVAKPEEPPIGPEAQVTPTRSSKSLDNRALQPEVSNFSNLRLSKGRTYIESIGAMESDFLSLRTDMAKIKLQMSSLITVLRERQQQGKVNPEVQLKNM